MHRGAVWVVAVAMGALLCCWTVPAQAQEREEPDPCADVAGRIAISGCWSREAERADLEMREAYDGLLLKLPPHAADALKKAQKLWLESRDAHLALLLAIANPSNLHRWEDSICNAIARRELSRERTRVLKRLAQPTRDEACPL